MMFPSQRLVRQLAVSALLCSALHAQTIQAPFNAQYSFTDLGSVPGVLSNYGGVAFKFDDPNILLIGGSANNPAGQIYSIPVARDPVTRRITGFVGTAAPFSTAPNIDGGLAYGPNNVLFFTGYSNNTIGQIKPGSTVPDRIDIVTSLGVASSTGSLTFVPPRFPGAGRLKVASYNASRIYDMPFVPDGNGTFTLQNTTSMVQMQGGLEGLVYVPPGSPLIADYTSILVCEYGTGAVSLYTVDATGDPVPASRQVFMSGLSGAEGATIDPITGEFLFCTYGGGSRVVVVRGFGSCGEFIRYGTGVAGAGSLIPQLTGSGCASPPRQFTVTVDQGRGGAFGVMFVGSGPLNIPVLGGTFLTNGLVDLVHSLGGSTGVAGQGTLAFPLTLPFNTTLIGQSLYFQAGYVDNAAIQGISMTGGLQIVIR